MHCPFTSEISKKRGREILILVMSYFFFFNVGVDTCVGSPPPPHSFTPLFVLFAFKVQQLFFFKQKSP